jgi:hypothetical protein
MVTAPIDVNWKSTQKGLCTGPSQALQPVTKDPLERP